MALFAISDLHLSFTTDKSMEVFRGWENYVERIQNNWTRVVSDSDTVVIPGDISWELKIENAVKDFEFLNNLPGKKYIIKGNHDLWWNSMKKMNEFLVQNNFSTITFLNNSAALEEGVSICGTRGWLIEESGTDSKLINREALRLKASLEEGRRLGENPIVFLHYPPVTDTQQCKEIIDVLKSYNVTKVYYGHLHGGSTLYAVNGDVDGINYKLVSADRVDFTPVLVH